MTIVKKGRDHSYESNQSRLNLFQKILLVKYREL